MSHFIDFLFFTVYLAALVNIHEGQMKEIGQKTSPERRVQGCVITRDSWDNSFVMELRGPSNEDIFAKCHGDAPTAAAVAVDRMADKRFSNCGRRCVDGPREKMRYHRHRARSAASVVRDLTFTGPF